MIKLKVEGMSCMHCENAVKKAVGALSGVTAVTASAKDKLVTVEGGSLPEITAAIEEEGYTVIK